MARSFETSWKGSFIVYVRLRGTRATAFATAVQMAGYRCRWVHRISFGREIAYAGAGCVGLDNFATGSRINLEDVRASVGEQNWRRLVFLEADICDLDACKEATRGARYVLHQAALGSVPRSIADPLLSNRANVEGFLNVLVAARDADVKRFVYAASSSTYGDHPGLPKVEDLIGKPLSPYAVTKYVNELYADVFARSYGMDSIGLRYFNVFGPRQDPQGAYAAVIPRWFEQLCRASHHK